MKLITLVTILLFQTFNLEDKDKTMLDSKLLLSIQNLPTLNKDLIEKVKKAISKQDMSKFSETQKKLIVKSILKNIISKEESIQKMHENRMVQLSSKVP
jgi:hypothetical protein